MPTFRNSSKTRQTTNRQRLSHGLFALMGSLLILGANQPTHAAQSNYRAAEGHTQTAKQLGSGLMTMQEYSAAPALQKNASSNDNHLTGHREPVLWLHRDIWITNIGTLLYKDDDQDGYFSGFSLTIDADTEYSHADVYVAIDVQRPEGERERLHTTGTFSLYGNSIADEYRVEIELVSNYPIGDYDLFVSLIDANNDAIVDQVDAYDMSNLSRLPLESEDVDNDPTPLNPTHPVQPQQINADIRVVEYSGAGSAWLLLALGIPALLRRTRKA